MIGLHSDELSAPTKFERVSAPVNLRSYPIRNDSVSSWAKGRYHKILDQAPKEQQVLDGHYVVTFKAGSFPYKATRADGSETFISLKGLTLTDRAVALVGDRDSVSHVIAIGDGMFGAFLPKDRIQYIIDQEDVESVRPNTRVRLSTASNWGLDRINQRLLPTDDDAIVAGIGNGSGVHVYIMDSGVRGTHNEFTGRVSTGYCPFPGVNPYVDSAGHGTHVAGIALGSTYGVAPGATLHSVRITTAGGGGGSVLDIIEAIVWIKDNRVMPAVVNCSFEITPVDNLEWAFYTLFNQKIPVVSAAGNDNEFVQYMPAIIDRCITVGATEVNETSTPHQDVQAFFSNFGDEVDIWAPGYDIESAWNSSDSSTDSLSGTSMAAPYVAGAVAVYLQNHQSDTVEEVRNALVANATRDVVAVQGGGLHGHILYLSRNWLMPNRIVADPQDPLAPRGGSLVNTDVLHPNGKYYDQVLMDESEITVHADSGQTTRVSWIDENYDIVMAEFTGSGNLRITLADYVAPASYPTLYYQPGVEYVKGKATITIEAPSENTSVAVFSLGTSNTLTPGLFVQPSSAYNGIADIKLVTFWRSQRRGEYPISYFGGLYTGNAVYSGSSGKVGVAVDEMHALQVKYRVVINDIDASSTAQPHLQLGQYMGLSLLSDSGRVRIASGNLFQTNGSRIRGTSSLTSGGSFGGLYTTANYDSHGRFAAPKALSSAQFSYFSGGSWQIGYDCIDDGGFPVSSEVTAP